MISMYLSGFSLDRSFSTESYKILSFVFVNLDDKLAPGFGSDKRGRRSRAQLPLPDRHRATEATPEDRSIQWRPIAWRVASFTSESAHAFLSRKVCFKDTNQLRSISCRVSSNIPYYTSATEIGFCNKKSFQF